MKEPERLVPDKDKEIRQFVLTLTRDMGLNRSAGRGGFIDSVMAATKTFYAEVLQNLTAWKAKPAKLPSERLPSEEAALPEVIEDAVEAAEAEAEPLRQEPLGD